MLAWLSRSRTWWNGLYEDNAESSETVSWLSPQMSIVLASALALYVELVMIRWHATCAHVFAIFKNVSLLSCFLGLGIGFALAARRKRVSLIFFLPLLAIQVAFFSFIATTLGGRRVNPVAEQLVMGQFGDEWSWLQAVEGNVFLAGIFVLNALMFIPIGNLTGRLMSKLPTMQSYSLNLIGSLSGIAAFFVMSLAWAPPTLWIGAVLLGAAPFLIRHPRLGSVGFGSLLTMLIALGLQGRLEERRYYSPYQAITLRLPPVKGDRATPTIKVNHAFYQEINDYSPAAVAANPSLAEDASYYNLPYQLQKKPGDVLVVGAGSGNDVAAALRHGATTVTAVEIDPAIQYIGKHIHPERPYQDKRTIAELNDARSFLRQTDERYDTIIYGLLDSHTNLGAMTNVRLDSFVYTVEGFREAAARLKDDGLLIVSYLILDPLQADKLYGMLNQACPDHTPRVFKSHRGLTFATGPGLGRIPKTVAGLTERTDEIAKRAENAEVATDDWPYFYMQKRTYPITYAGMILLLLVLSGWIVKRKLGKVSVTSGKGSVFFFLGAGFMLVETKSITELGLVFGNTWLVNAVAIAGILVMGFLANQWIVRKGQMPLYTTFALLGGTLVLGLVTTRLSMAGVVLPLSKLLMPLILTSPLFFAGLIFSGQLSEGGEIGDAISANLFGAMLGGFLEYNSMYWGLSSLYPLGLVLYGCAFVCCLRNRKQQQAATAPALQQAA